MKANTSRVGDLEQAQLGEVDQPDCCSSRSDELEGRQWGTSFMTANRRWWSGTGEPGGDRGEDRRTDDGGGRGGGGQCPADREHGQRVSAFGHGSGVEPG